MAAPLPCYHANMSHQNTSPFEGLSQEVLRDPPEVRIAEANAITMPEALPLAQQMGVPIGKSTLQRWAKVWTETPGSAVKAVLQVTRTGRHYEIDRDDYESWLLEQAENQQTPPDPIRPDKARQGLDGSHEAPEDLGRSSEASGDNDALAARVTELETENLQLQIDVGVRRELVNRAKVEMDALHARLQETVKENGALDFQLRQLAAPSQSVRQIDAPDDADREGDNGEAPAVTLL